MLLTYFLNIFTKNCMHRSKSFINPIQPQIQTIHNKTISKNPTKQRNSINSHPHHHQKHSVFHPSPTKNLHNRNRNHKTHPTPHYHTITPPCPNTSTTTTTTTTNIRRHSTTIRRQCHVIDRRREGLIRSIQPLPIQRPCP